MYYYIIENRIVPYEEELEPKHYNHKRLDDKQSAFYEKTNCSLEEALKCELNIPYVPTLEELKTNKIDYFSQLAFEKRNQLLPEYKIVNAGIDIYDELEKDKIKSIVQEFRKEFYRLKSLVENASDEKELNSIIDNYRTNED